MNNHTDLTDEQWQAIEGIVPACQAGGRPEKWARRAIVDAILYKFATDCSWRQLPTRYPKWNTVFVYYNRWRDDGTWWRVQVTLIGMGYILSPQVVYLPAVI